MPFVDVISKALHYKAIKFDGNNLKEIKRVLKNQNFVDIPNKFHKPYVTTLHGRLYLFPGDWVVQGHDGDIKIYPDNVYRYQFSEASKLIPKQREEVNESN